MYYIYFHSAFVVFLKTGIDCCANYVRQIYSIVCMTYILDVIIPLRMSQLVK